MPAILGQFTLNVSPLGAVPVGSAPPTPVAATFSKPISITFDGESLWVCDRNLTFVHKIYVSSDQPYASQVLDLNSLSLGITGCREIRHDSGSGLLFVSAMDSLYFIVIDPTNGSYVGKMHTAHSGFWLARSCTFDGAGNVYALAVEEGGSNSRIEKFSIASILATYPSVAAPTSTWTFAHPFESLTFGGGYIWAGAGNRGESDLFRIDPSSGSLTSGTGAYAVWSAHYAFGSIWTANSGNFHGASRWSDLSTRVDLAVLLPGFDGSLVSIPPLWAMSEPAVDGTSIWFGQNQAADHVLRYVAATNVQTAIRLSREIHAGESYIEATDGVAFDGTNIWMTARYGSALFRKPGIMRFAMTPGAEQVNYRLISSSETAYVSSVVPNRSRSFDGTKAITIRGKGFTSATSVDFDVYSSGIVTATGFAVVNDTTITCIAPSAPANWANVIVRRPSTDLKYGDGLYFEGINGDGANGPFTGTTAGGVGLTLIGMYLGTATGVLLNGVPCVNFVMISDHQLACQSPAKSPATPGVVDMVIQRTDGDLVYPNYYTYT
jgi:hypothetical protein